jgi:hypothetical protein
MTSARTCAARLVSLVVLDHDRLEVRNLDRTLGAYPEDVAARMRKVTSAKRLVDPSHTSATFIADPVEASLLAPGGLASARSWRRRDLHGSSTSYRPAACVNTVAFLAAIGEGLADVNAGRVLTTQELKKSFEAEFGPIAWQ